MPLGWNEIKKRAIEFSREYADATRERAETQSFYNDFFHVFGISRRRVATYEAKVKKLGNAQGFIDLFWPGTLLIEQKSTGRDLDKAFDQALDYFPNLKEHEVPRYVLISDFQTLNLRDLETGETYSFRLSDLHKHIEKFGFIAGYQKRKFEDQDPVNIKASELMGALYDQLDQAGYHGQDLQILLVRLLFCLFAENTDIFDRDWFLYYIETHTREDGLDLGQHLALMFQVLNTSTNQRSSNLGQDLSAFPYVNGSLFAAPMQIPAFNSGMRDALLTACHFDWSQISPAIFGSLFQSVMDKDKRRGIGAHYTSEQNILKTIHPLFLDELYAEFEKAKSSKSKLQQLQDKLASLTFFDPACGCGNFLILAYREIRTLETLILQELHKSSDQMELDVAIMSKVTVDQFYGIELEAFPAKIAEVAMWLMDHQMNMQLSLAFGQYYKRLPLQDGAHIVCGNALELDWADVVPPAKLNYILGNPPFVGSKYQTPEQRQDMKTIFIGIKGAGDLDYVAAWYLKAAQMMQGTRIKCAFVSTNSITQGVQVAVLWQPLLRQYNIKIHFAHRTFQWNSEARGKAAVHCVIIGFAAVDTDTKYLYDYENPRAEPQASVANNINPYLVDATDQLVMSATRQLCSAPKLINGSIAADGGGLILSDNERNVLLEDEPHLSKYVKRYMGATDYINDTKRFCLWLMDCPPQMIRNSEFLCYRIHVVKKARAGKQDKATPSVFRKISQPASGSYLAIPRTSSEARDYIPIGFLSSDIIANNDLQIIPFADLYVFGIVTSQMHMAWVKVTSGRLKNDYRYSAKQTYNTFSWPDDPTDKQRQAIESAAQAVLDARAQFPDSSLADLYDPLSMPPVLLKAHQTLDKAVDKAYRGTKFENEQDRLAFLFDRYRALTAPLDHMAAPATKKRRGRKRKS